MDDELIEFRKTISDYKKQGKIEECFYHDKTKCNGKIKQSHSLQRNGRLSILEGDINGNKCIYTFTSGVIGKNHFYDQLKPIGKGEASTFFGFCDFHDTNLFSPVENNPFDGSDKHCFLHSYRSFAHSYHRKKEQLKSLQIDSLYTSKLPQEIREIMIEGALMALNDVNKDKQKLDSLIENEDYEGLEYLFYEIPKTIPIACSTLISPHFSYKGTPINNHIDPNKPFSSIMLTVLPDVDKTIIIFACFPDDSNGIIFFDDFKDIHPLALEKAISSILIHYVENTFLAPSLYDKLEKKGQRMLCDELENMGDPSYVPNSFPKSRINFFENKFSITR